MVIVWLLQLLQMGHLQGRLLLENFEVLKTTRSLLQFEDNCTIGSELILEEYPSFVSLRDPLDREYPNLYTICGGVLLTTQTLLTTTGCIWTGRYNLVNENPLNRTIDKEFLVAVSPFCTHGNGSELVQVLGYHFMEESYDGFPKNGHAVAVLDLKSNVTQLTDSELPSLRTRPLPLNSTLTLVGHGATTQEEIILQPNNFSRPAKVINFETISDQQCQQFLNNLQPYKELDVVTESCAVVQEVTDLNVCNGDDGGPLFDVDGNVAGVLTWWPVNQCYRIRNQTMPIIFADVTKSKVLDFIKQAETEPLYVPTNVTDGCGDGQTLEDAPWSVSIQQQRSYGPTGSYHHFCGGVLIDNGTKIITTASCIWDEFSPLPTSAQASSGGLTTWQQDFRQYQKPYQGIFQFPIFVALAPRCRHFNGKESRNELSTYVIHPEYNGDPQKGNNIAILGLKEQFPPESSFPLFLETLKNIGNPSISDFSNVMFYSWGAEFRSESLEDETVFFNNWFPAKEVSMELISEQNCAQGIPAEDPERVYNRLSELCTDQPGPNFTNICMYDNGGPLVGNDIASNDQLVLLGLKSQLQDRQCFDAPGSYEVFTDVIEMKDFILSVLDPEDHVADHFPPIDNGESTIDNNIIIAAVVGVVLFILIITLIAYRYVSYNNKAKRKLTSLLADGTSPGQSTQTLQLNKEIQNIHFMLAKIARKHRSPGMGKARRHSDLAASLKFLLAQDKVQNQIASYTMFALDDSVLNATRGTFPLSPFLLAMMNKNLGVSAIVNNQTQIQRVLGGGQNQQIWKRIQLSMAMKFGSNLTSLKSKKLGSGLILPDTPAREDFNLAIDFEKELVIGDRLGTGAFGSVYKAFWITRNMNVAVKIVHAHILEQLMDDLGQGGSYLNSIITELSLLSRIDSPYIVQCFGGCLKPPNICLVLEYLPKGSLDSFIHEYHGSIPIGLIMRVAQGIAEGLDALHPTVVHRDLKPQNILLDDSYQVKIADFGISKLKEDSYLSETMIKGTPAYIAPEAFKAENVDEKSDIYALGLIIWEMISKKHPWQEFPLPVQIMARVGIYGERPPIPDSCPNELKKLIQHCWEANPRERPSAREVATKLTILRERMIYKGSKTNDDSAFMKHFELLQKNANRNQSTQNEGSFDLNYSYAQFSLHSVHSVEKR